MKFFQTERRTTSKLCVGNTEEEARDPVPKCSHGHALKFSRFDKKTGSEREFYACSSSRDRKICSLFYWADDWKRKVRSGSFQDIRTMVSVEKPTKKYRFDSDLGVEALTDNSTNAQYLFDNESVDLICSVIDGYSQRYDSKRVLCIGTPFLHKRLLELRVESVLLDEDERLTSVFPTSCIRFNMFNGNLYGNASPGDDFGVVVMDPPFHPELLPALFKSLRSIFPSSLGNLVLFAFPYFHSVKVENAFDGLLKITDVRLTYRNHKKYTTGERSPVRLFSSENFSSFMRSLGDSSMYKLCESCDSFAYKSNKHCDECNKCSSIAGKTGMFFHCKLCGKCVKQKHACIL